MKSNRFRNPFVVSFATVIAATLIAFTTTPVSRATDTGTTASAAPESELGKVLLPAIERHRGKVAVAVKHLGTGESYRYNADEPMPTASLIKFPVMAAAYRAIEDGKLALDDMVELKEEDEVPGSGILTPHFSPGTRISLRDAIQLMMVYSDNTATNLVIDELGLPVTSEYMESLGLDDTKLHAKVYRRDTSIAPERSRRFGLGSTTAGEMLTLLEKLHQRKLVSQKASEKMLEHMFACDDTRKSPRLLPPGTRVAHKTGSVSASRTDAGIIESPAGPIAFCILTNENEDQSWSDENEGDLLCAVLARAAYDFFNSDDEKPAATAARTLRIGDKGELVELLQRTINARLEPSPEMMVDGDFGPETQAGVRDFQRQADLEPTGVVDFDTWRALGPLVTADEPTPDPETINTRPDERLPRDELDGPPLVTAKAWAVVDADSGELLRGENEDERRHPASTTKMMTAYVITSLAEEDPTILDEIVTFSERADQTPGSTCALKAGEQVSVAELLYGLMLPSGNDASVALAEHFGARLSVDANAGDEADAYDSFIEAMNRTAKEIGMDTTRFRNPHGLTARGHQTTARDLARLAYVALQQPEFAKRVATPRRGATVDSVSGYQRHIVWRNTNRLLRREGFDGVKTGTTSAAGACLVSRGDRDDRRLIVVVLGSSSTDARYVDTRNLFRWAWKELVHVPCSDEPANSATANLDAD